jgi:hypothetical protein
MMLQGVFYSTSGKVTFGPGATKLSRAKKLDAIIRACDDYGRPYPTNELAKLARIVQLAETGMIVVATAETLAGARLMVAREAAPPPLHPQEVPAAVPFPGMVTAQQVPISSNLASFGQVQAAAYPGVQADVQTMARMLQAMQGAEARMENMLQQAIISQNLTSTLPNLIAVPPVPGLYGTMMQQEEVGAVPVQLQGECFSDSAMDDICGLLQEDDLAVVVEGDVLSVAMSYDYVA